MVAEKVPNISLRFSNDTFSVAADAATLQFLQLALAAATCLVSRGESIWRAGIADGDRQHSSGINFPAGHCPNSNRASPSSLPTHKWCSGLTRTWEQRTFRDFHRKNLQKATAKSVLDLKRGYEAPVLKIQSLFLERTINSTIIIDQVLMTLDLSRTVYEAPFLERAGRPLKPGLWP